MLLLSVALLLGSCTMSRALALQESQIAHDTRTVKSRGFWNAQGHVCSPTSQIDSIQNDAGEKVPACVVQSDKEGYPWVYFGDLNDRATSFNANSLGTSSSGRANGGAVQVGTFNTGTIGTPGYSLDLQDFLKASGDQPEFDMMIQFGGNSVYSVSVNNFKRRSHEGYNKGWYINNDGCDKDNYGNQCKRPATTPEKTGSGAAYGASSRSGHHGIYGDYVALPASDGQNRYATYCAVIGGCGSSGYDFFSFSTHGVYPSSGGVVPCGFHIGGWQNCGQGDNQHRMRYYIRFHEPLGTPLEGHGHGDPHLQNIKGEDFDVMQEGNMLLVETPRHSTTSTLDFALRADIDRLGAALCGPTYITQIGMEGRWVGDSIHIKAGKVLKTVQDQVTDGKNAFAIRLFDTWRSHVSVDDLFQGSVELPNGVLIQTKPRTFVLKVKGLHIVVSQPKRPRVFLDLQVTGLETLSGEVGGLLGIDDHAEAENLPAECQ